MQQSQCELLQPIQVQVRYTLRTERASSSWRNQNPVVMLLPHPRYRLDTDTSSRIRECAHEGTLHHSIQNPNPYPGT